MYTLALAALVIAPAQPPAKHEDQNPLYKGLLETGLDVGGGVKTKFPAPFPYTILRHPFPTGALPCDSPSPHSEPSS